MVLRARAVATALGSAALLSIAACRTGRDYAAADVPRQAAPPPRPPPARADSLRVVSFNVAFARRPAEAAALLAADAATRGADVVLLQEMDADGTRRVAEALGMGYVYYPAIRHRRTRRDFGNAVLTRWPVAADARLVLPHPSRYAGTHRTATAATLAVGAARVRVYSTHLGTALDVGDGARRAQLRAVLADAAALALAVVGGDFNDGGVAAAGVAAGFAWATRAGPRTTRFGRWDHVLVKGLRVAAAGTGPDARGVSDHRPVWAVALLP
ncbi:endonuclease/exonuclease/phosphatase family protein [Roseisolibacter sp. H3M3-2]|uniref:endonuclease/exonuclease/phosphatase family protein n=1 Tax=Roseisolibacter sp. H3M3-2 TaxID=3031323 RepID=UPI0023DA66D7|nr:endonuclease/exonuclease/phosphatase family protein [Roseisolibacter sp. H3M3-2]MDF1506016.1 endonuclease/exonuclease/phosphatase family protein [Roseisolibacter sp. H3M3-2]